MSEGVSDYMLFWVHAQCQKPHYCQNTTLRYILSSLIILTVKYSLYKIVTLYIILAAYSLSKGYFRNFLYVISTIYTH